MFRRIQHGLLRGRIRIRGLFRRRTRQEQRIRQIEQRVSNIREQIPLLMLEYSTVRNDFFKLSLNAFRRAQREKRTLNPRETAQIKHAWKKMWEIENRFNENRIALEKDEQWLAKKNWGFSHPKKTGFLRRVWHFRKFFNDNQGKILDELKELADGFTNHKARETDSLPKP